VIFRTMAAKTHLGELWVEGRGKGGQENQKNPQKHGEVKRTFTKKEERHPRGLNSTQKAASRSKAGSHWKVSLKRKKRGPQRVPFSGKVHHPRWVPWPEKRSFKVPMKKKTPYLKPLLKCITQREIRGKREAAKKSLSQEGKRGVFCGVNSCFEGKKELFKSKKKKGTKERIPVGKTKKSRTRLLKKNWEVPPQQIKKKRSLTGKEQSLTKKKRGDGNAPDKKGSSRRGKKGRTKNFQIGGGNLDDRPAGKRGSISFGKPTQREAHWEKGGGSGFEQKEDGTPRKGKRASITRPGDRVLKKKDGPLTSKLLVQVGKKKRVEVITP